MKITLLLILLCIIGFFLPVFSGVEEAFDNYGFSGENLVSRPWVLLTSVFLHNGLAHLLSNMFILFFFGIAVEAELGKKMLLVFFLGAFAGSFLSLFVYPFDTISVGASAGIFALVGTGILVRPFDLSFYPLVVPVPLAFLGIFYAIYNAYGFVAELSGLEAASNISYIAHFGGLFVGLYFGFREAGKKEMRMALLMFLIMIIAPLLWILLF